MNDLAKLILKEYLPVKKIIKENFYKNIKNNQELLTSKNTEDMIGVVEFTVFLNGVQTNKKICHFQPYCEYTVKPIRYVIFLQHFSLVYIGYEHQTFYVEELPQRNNDIIDINIKTTLIDKTMFLKM